MGEADFRTARAGTGRFARRTETRVRRQRTVTTRVFVVLAIVAAAAFALSGCSPGSDYPPLFPAVHDAPPPRADTTMDANQVQQATEDLISDRNRLSAQSQGSGQSANAPPPPATQKSPESAAPAGSHNAQGIALVGAQPPETQPPETK